MPVDWTAKGRGRPRYGGTGPSGAGFPLPASQGAYNFVAEDGKKEILV